MSVKKTVIFDLDDTLYPEIEYIESGFKAVAKIISVHGFNEELIFKRLMSILEKYGRGKVFDILLDELKIDSKFEIMHLLFIYRSHLPDISIDNETEYLLKDLKRKGFKLAVITDGAVITQINKVKALGIENLFDKIIYTDILGKDYWKPSIIPYKILLDLLGERPENSFYIGDNPAKDFKGANELGITSIRLTEYNKWEGIMSDDPLCKPDYVFDNYKELYNFFNAGQDFSS